LTEYVTGAAESDAAPEVFRRGIEALDVRGVVLRNTERAGEARKILRAAGFRRTLNAVDHEIWVRSPAPRALDAKAAPADPIPPPPAPRGGRGGTQ
jgi:hypothetical protein